MTDTPLAPDDAPDPDDDLLGYDDLLAAGLSPADARAVLGPHTALSRREVEDGYELLRREREGRP
jgi:hypothetical protein